MGRRLAPALSTPRGLGFVAHATLDEAVAEGLPHTIVVGGGAVILSVQIGLRNGEIRHLRLDELDWGRGVLRVVESNEGKSRELPLPERAGEALAEYIRHGRPYSPQREVFVRHRVPGGLLTAANAVAGIISRLAKRAGVNCLP